MSLMKQYSVMISHLGKIMKPPVEDGVRIEWQRSGQPGKMTFTCVKTAALSFSEGDAAAFLVDGVPLFVGFVFTKARSGQSSSMIKVTVYDQIYYLTRNKDTYNYSGKTAADVIRMIADDFHLKKGLIAPTPYLIENRIEDGKTLYDIINNALKLTTAATGQMYVLYDNAGLLTLTPIEMLKLPIVLRGRNIGDFDYQTSIAEDTYNRIKLVHEDSESGKRTIFLTQDAVKEAQWGVLQYYEKIDDKNGAQAKAMQLLAAHNRKLRKLKLKNVLGDTRVHAGTSVIVQLGLGDMNLSNYMMVEQVSHTFKENEHTMDLQLRGGKDFVA